MTIEQQAILQSIDMTLGEESRNIIKKQIKKRKRLGDCTYYIGAPIIKKQYTEYHVVCIVSEEKRKEILAKTKNPTYF